ncbi:hypothetical protein AX16_004837 [Volvariella volvacea WC 439]|nr:hypothetical protein AX16_004837 [Volvariella volvacea WC 439]
MLAITTTNGLTVIEPASLKKTSQLQEQHTLTASPTSSSWTSSGAALFISSSHQIHRFDHSQRQLIKLYHSLGDKHIAHAIAKDSNTIIFSVGELIHILNCNSESTPSISQSFNSHTSPITSLSLSNDDTLLASTSTGVVHVHNLTLGSHTILRGLKFPPTSNQAIDVCVFHPHTSTKLLVAFGHQLAVYDTTKPLAPSRVIGLTGFTSRVVSVTCSPFSKTLVAVASADGTVGLVDLEKEKGLFRTLDTGVAITACEFSPEGALIYVGTELGKLLIIDLRGLEKPPREIEVSESGSSIQTISVQRKPKSSGGDSNSSRPGTITKSTVQLENRKPTSTRKVSSPVSKTPVSPARTTRSNRTVSPIGSISSPRRVPLSRKESSSNVPVSPTIARRGMITIDEKKRRVVSPISKDVGRDVNKHGVLPDIKISMPATQILKSPKASAKSSMHARENNVSGDILAGAPNNEAAPRRVRVAPSTLLNAGLTARKASAPGRLSPIPPASGGDPLVETDAMTRPRASSMVSDARSARPSSRAGTTMPQVVEAPTSDLMSRVMALDTGSGLQRTDSMSSGRTTSTKSSSRTRALATPSPDLLGLDEDDPTIRRQQRPKSPVTPPSREKRAKPNVLKAINGKEKGRGKGKEKSVVFEDGLHDEDEEDEHDQEYQREREREQGMAMQLSPLRPGHSSASSATTNMWLPSPLRNPGGGGGGGANPAHALLKGLVRDAMYEYQEETRSQLLGMHMDLIRMNTGFKQEFRGIMEEYLGELKELREENKRLREENEKLRRSRF